MSNEESNKGSFREKLKKLFSKKNIFIIFLIAVLGFQYLQSSSNSSNLSFLQSRDSSLIEEIGELKETYLKVGEDMNEIRRYLMLPLKEYQKIELSTDDEEDKNKDQVQLALFKYVGSVVNSESIREKISTNKAFIDNLLISKDFSEFLIKEELAFSPTVQDDENFIVKIASKSGDPIVTYSLDNQTGDLIFQTVIQKESVEEKDFSKFKQNLMKFLTDKKSLLIAGVENVKKLKESIAKAIESKSVQNILTKKALVLSADPDQSELEIIYSVLNKSNDIVGEIILETSEQKIALVDKNEESAKVFVTNSSDLTASLPSFLEKLEYRSILEQNAEISIASFKKTLEDKGFKALLAEGALVFKGPLEENNRILYTLHDQKDAIVSTFAIEKATGIVTVTDNSGNKDQNLLFFEQDVKKKP
ncbi:MAG: hypothetical protein PHP74_04250 [Candidatus Gracilibacteria bacterium]|nr:hypothetical protein [Candidatus Gracilibacteria bacterium]